MRASGDKKEEPPHLEYNSNQKLCFYAKKKICFSCGKSVRGKNWCQKIK